MGDDKGHLVVGSCHYDKTPVLGCHPPPPLHSGREISSKETFQKKNTNNYERNLERMEFIVASLCGSYTT